MNAKLNTENPSGFISSSSNSSLSKDTILSKAQQYAQDHELNFSGSLSPTDAWQLVQQGEAVLVDVRTNEERKFVGYVPESVHVAWATGTSFNRNPRFLKELESKVGKVKTILLLCRSGNRSAQAAEAAFNAGLSTFITFLKASKAI